jgi:alkylation response protein AidB-like acyl-CoA dehydrogenase
MARPPGPSGSELLARARALYGALDAGAEAGEAKGSLTEEAADSLRQGGFLGLWVPKALGGSSLRPLEVFEVIEAITYADSSVGWVLSVASLAAGGAGVFLGDEAVAQMFQPDCPPFMAGQGVPIGKAEALAGGRYHLSGNWSYGSGIGHADFVCVGAVIHEDGAQRLREGAPESRIFFLPREQVTLAGNWDVLGLRGTGSVDHSISKAMVLEDYSFPTAGANPLRQAYPAFGFAMLTSVGHSAFALGVGRRMLDEITRLVHSRRGRPGALGDSESFLEDYARAQAGLRAARSLVKESWSNAEEVFERGGKLSVEHDSLLRLSMIEATNVVADICTFGYRIAGGTSLRKGVIQRLFRDIHAGTQHIICSTPMLRNCGREILNAYRETKS